MKSTHSYLPSPDICISYISMQTVEMVVNKSIKRILSIQSRLMDYLPLALALQLISGVTVFVIATFHTD